MADELLIRVYDVGLGDCILCRIPGAMRVDGAAADFHMLIDCGSWSGGRFLEAALKNLATRLPDTDGGKKRLDLLVITHEHKDHIAGCDPAHQGKGLGGAAVRAGLERAAGRLPAYLETAKERNLAFYQRLGFRVTDEWSVPGGGPRFWSMLREADG